MDSMRDEGSSRPGDRELRHAGRAAIIGVTAWFFAELLSGQSSITLQALTYLFWLTTFLALATFALAVSIGLWKRAH